MLIDRDEFNALFDSYKQSAWRWENQPAYTMSREQETLALFLAGEPMPEGFNSAWHKRVSNWVNSGKSIGRARTVRRPLTDYQRYWLSWAGPTNTAAGEDIRVLDLDEHDLGMDLPEQDFWMFDESMVVYLNFRPDGTLISFEQLEEPDLEYHLKLRDTALAHAVPINEWNART